MGAPLWAAQGDKVIFEVVCLSCSKPESIFLPAICAHVSDGTSAVRLGAWSGWTSHRAAEPRGDFQRCQAGLKQG